MGILSSQKPAYLRLRCDKRYFSHLLESPLAFDRTVEEISETQFDLTVTVVDTQNLRWWLR